ncbi:MAG: PhoX family phosphatase [Pseudomonadota bacterium]
MSRRDIIANDAYGNKGETSEAFDDIPTNPNLSNTIGDVIQRRYGRRDFLRGSLAVAATTSLFGTTALTSTRPALAASAADSRFIFEELAWGNDVKHHIANGYYADILVRWGDPITADAPEFDVMNQTADAQARQFGYNNDYVGFVETAPGRGMLCVNHEYTNEEVMFPKIGRQDRSGFKDMTKELADIEMAAHGGSVFEIVKGGDGKWAVNRDNPINRRITANTPITFDGPAAGHPRLRTTADPSGMTVLGTINNCAGGITPWGTYLMAEENFHLYFWTDTADGEGDADLTGVSEEASRKRYGVPGMAYAWGKFHDRFNIDKEPNEPNRFGYVVEVDPLNPNATPIKHTALGRFRHEGAETTIASDGRLVIYSGDDNRFDYQYKWVSAEIVSEENSHFGSTLLSEGTLYVARFNDDGVVDWLPLIHGEGPLTADNGFESQADIAIDTRLAADVLGATPMDRPEDAQPRGDGVAYIMLTNNSKRKADQLDKANPRPESRFGHIVEIREDGGNHSATKGTWSILVLCGDPKLEEVGAMWNPETSENGWFGSPDNCAIDDNGRLWISTDQGRNWGRTGKSDGLYALETEGDLRGHSKLFFRCPVGGELCGPYFADESKTLFLAVQHPGTDGTKDFAGFERNSTFEDPATRWPDFDAAMPPRPSVVVVTKEDGGVIAV